jgi:hypothetical protein
MMTSTVKVIETRMNSMFELATQDEIDKLRQVNSRETPPLSTVSSTCPPNSYRPRVEQQPFGTDYT